MVPVLLDLKIVKIYTFGVFLVLGFFWASFLLWKLIRLTSYKEEELFDTLFISIAGSLVGGRLLYIILHFDAFGFDLLKFILINGYPGLSLYGALFGGFITLFICSSQKRMKFLDVVGYFIPPVYMALGFGKLGSFFSGIEAGSKTSFFLSTNVVGYEGARHTTSFYEALLFFLGAFISYKILFDIRREKYPKGLSFYFFIWFFAFVYFIFDSLKTERVIIYKTYTFDAMVSFILLLTFSFYFMYYFRVLIMKRVGAVSNLIITYGKQTYQTVYTRAKQTFTRRKRKTGSTDRES